MEISIALPNAGPEASLDAVVRVAAAADELGFAGIYASDHLLVPGPERERYGRVFEPLVLLTHLAGLTERVRLGTSVLLVALRNPFVVAKQAATLDILSRGRLILGVGAGWIEGEFDNVGADFHRRGARTEEALLLFRHLFSGSQAPFEGRFHRYRDGAFAPLPLQGAALPLLAGGSSAAAIRRASRLADVWQTSGVGAEDFPPLLALLRREAGARPVRAGARCLLEGSPSEMLAAVRDWEAAGADHLVVRFGRDPGRRVDLMRTFAREVLPQL